MGTSVQLKALAKKLFEIGAVKFGDFETKSGLRSPIYFDLRVIISYPAVMEELSNILLSLIETQSLEYEHLCGVPYTALPIATLISNKQKKPMLIRRKEAKSYGTKKSIEGIFERGDTCLIIEDIITSGSSILETVAELRSTGIEVKDAIVIIDREQGGYTNIQKQKIGVHSLFKISEFLTYLNDTGDITNAKIEEIMSYINTNQVKDQKDKIVRTEMSFESRKEHMKCQLSKDLVDIMLSKQTLLCLAADAETTAEVLHAANIAGPYICILKTHIDIIKDFSVDFLRDLESLAKKYNFMIMEDRKFADIGNTMLLQLNSGVFNIISWAHLITAHSLPGPGVLQAVNAALSETSALGGIFIVTELSAAGALTTQTYVKDTMNFVDQSEHPEIIAGVVCQSKEIVQHPGLLQLTPGCHIDTTTDSLGQQYNGPNEVVIDKGADIVVVGRGILKSNDIRASAELYRDQLWSAYSRRIQAKRSA